MISWVTSFSPDIYDATGRDFIASAVANPLPGTLFIAPESMPKVDGTPANAVVLPDLSISAPLQVWLRANADIIPHDKGGLWRGPCKCKRPSGRKDQDHTMPCPGAWYCRNASRWFRKIIALKQAMSLVHDGALVFWLDCDTIVKQSPTEQEIGQWFASVPGAPPADILYMKTAKRPVWETGIVGFRGKTGKQFLDAVLTRFITGAFRKDKRWDDSYQLMQMASLMPTAKCKDVAVTTSGHADVVPHSVYAPFFTHRKGHHSRVTKIVT